MVEIEDIPEPDRIEGARHPRFATDIVGQDAAISEFMARYHGGRLHHGWLLTGPAGVGKASFAWAAARTLLEEADCFGGTPDAPIARRIASLAEPRLTLCRRPWDDKTKKLKTRITVDEVRKLKSFFSLSAADGGWRVAIVDAADEMNPAAANALLKILEEPPEKAAIFLVAHQPGRLLPTIRSRTVALPFSTLAPKELAMALAASEVKIDSSLEALAELSGGSAGHAMRILASGGTALYEKILSTLSDLPRLDRQKVLALSEAATGRDGEDLYGMTRQMLSLLVSRAARAAATGEHPPEAAPGEAQILSRLAPNVRAAGIWADTLPEIEAKANHAAAVNLDPASVILDTFLRIEEAARRL